MTAPFDPIAELQAISPRALPLCRRIADGRPITPALVYEAAAVFRDGSMTGYPHPRIARRLHNLAALWSVLHRDVTVGGAA